MMTDFAITGPGLMGERDILLADPRRLNGRYIGWMWPAKRGGYTVRWHTPRSRYVAWSPNLEAAHRMIRGTLR